MTTDSTEISPSPQGKRGILVIVVLSVIFFVLLVLLLRAGASDNRPGVSRSEEFYVLPLRMRIRTQPVPTAPVLATAIRGDRLTLVEDRGAWVRVRNREGIEGWADRSGLEGSREHERRMARAAAIKRLPTLEGEVEKRVPLYAGPGIFYSIVGELDPQNRVRIYTRDHDFYAIESGDDIAYAEVDAISLSSSGIPQFDVGIAGGATTPEVEEQEPPLAFPELPPADVPPMPEPAVPAVESRVYPAVPPGGTQPEVIERVVPRYPRDARSNGTQGAVVVRAIIRRDGTVDDVEVLREPGDGLGEAAARAVRQWRFRPARYQGEPIDVYYTVTMNFRLD